MPRELLNALAWIIPIVILLVTAVVIYIRVKRRGPSTEPRKGIHIRRKGS